jgi:NAD(P)H-nitrite reductase large subunit
MHYVIIGGSVAGISAAKTIRGIDSSANLVVISSEKSKPYYRPMVPLVVEGKKSEADIAYPEDPFAMINVRTVFDSAQELKVRSKEVVLASGAKIPYDRLLLATGGTPFLPAIDGIKGNGVFVLRTMDDAVRIRDAAAVARSVVVIGGGLVGIKAATALRFRKAPGQMPMEVTVVEMLPQILSQRLDTRGAEMVRGALVAQGIAIMTNESVKAITRDKQNKLTMKLSSGNMLEADMIVVAAGVNPNIACLKGTGIETSIGVLVNEFLMTNVAGVFAAGDVVEGRELLSGEKTVSGLWSIALEMGRVAGMNMAGKNVQYPGFLSVMNAAEIAGIPFISVGMIEPKGNRYETISYEDENGYWKLVLDGENLVGAVSVGDLRNAGIYTNLIKNRIPISRKKERIIKKEVGYADFLSALSNIGDV